ncbi:hypothetical protein D0Y65_039665 [Glycine soja]|uniref:Uncharacterized protein n=2 Tax=Glycine subgen. Soja TaxID=1462606 RepID=K7M8Z1_SOYBN|nr:hypothetical protein JHK87_041042 [Glycine soja]RZB62468.1 hypothetical protein D0Y65_039665 [Glycine soja]
MRFSKASFPVLYIMWPIVGLKLRRIKCATGAAGGRGQSSRWSSYVRIFCTPFVCVDNLMTKLKMPSWRTFWRKIKWEKRRLFSSSPAVHVQYDPSSYSQNFDDGYSTDPDNLSRSFSARFAVPSKIFDKSEMVCNGDK